MIAAMQRQIAEASSLTARSARPRVWCEEWGKPIISSQTWVAELVAAAGGDFVGVPGRQALVKDVCRLDPEVIIAAWCGAGDRVPLEKIIRERGWEGTAAALSGRVFCIRDEFLNTPAPTLLQGLQALASRFIPNSLLARKESDRLMAFPHLPLKSLLFELRSRSWRWPAESKKCATS